MLIYLTATSVMPIEIRRVSHGWAVHERKRKAAERIANQFSPLPEKKSVDPAQAHWDNMVRAVRREFPESSNLRKIFEDNKNRSFFRRFTAGRRAITLNLEKAIPDYENLQREYLEDKSSPRYNPEFWDSASEILKVITRETQHILAPKSPTKR